MGVRLGVTAIVGEGVCVAVGDSVSVAVDDGEAASEGVCVIVGVSMGWLGRGIIKKANRIITRRPGIPNLISQGGSDSIAF